jgi:hypothetical protein
MVDNGKKNKNASVDVENNVMAVWIITQEIME